MIVEILNIWHLPSDAKCFISFLCKMVGSSFSCLSKCFSFRLATYGLEELKMEGDGNCQVRLSFF
jgi:hypothetical protein